jgi:tRNA A37 threonylcarbamoyladenosine biosynthesis protein TsaE
MSILDHFKNISPTTDQLQAIKQLELFLNNDSDIFILQGYAGSGKTTLLKGFIDHLNTIERNFKLMAPTGRAAKVIHQKTGHVATTVHKGIYSFEDLEDIKASDSNEKTSFRYYFKLRNNVNVYEHIFIVDEASMLSNNLSQGEFFRFGSGYLLKDLISFTRIQTGTAKTKIIFIGDSAQLPPVGMNFSPALDLSYLEKTFNLKIESIEMKEVKRQDADNEILLAASKIRKCLTSGFFNEFDLRPNNKEIFNPTYTNFLRTYSETEGQKIIISYKNKTAVDLNNLIRRTKYGSDQQIQASDIVIIGANNYNLGVLNGEFAVVVNAENILTTRTISFFTGKGITSTVELKWRKIELIIPDDEGIDKSIQAFMLENFLTGDNYLKTEEMQALYEDFKNRNPNLKPKSIEFSEALKNDKFFNCIQLKYGYAVTCHKAQGGEWENAFVFWDKGVSNDPNFNFYQDHQLKNGKSNDDFYRWAYTAITRASKKLHAINPPFFNCYTNMSFLDSSIQNSFKQLSNHEIKPIELEFTDEFLEILKQFNLDESSLEIQNHFLQIYYHLKKHYIEIIGWQKVNLEIRYFFKRVNEIVAAKFWINQKNVFNKNFMQLPQPNDSRLLFDTIKSILDQSETIVLHRNRVETVLTKILFEAELEENKPFLSSLFDAVESSCTQSSFRLFKLEHFPYRERYYFERETEKAIIDFEYDKQGIFGRVVPLENNSNSADLMFEVKQLVNNLISTSHVI